MGEITTGKTIFYGNRNPQSRELARRVLAQLAQTFLVVILAIWIQLAEHALDGRAHDFPLVQTGVVIFQDARIYGPETLPTSIYLSIRIFRSRSMDYAPHL